MGGDGVRDDYIDCIGHSRGCLQLEQSRVLGAYGGFLDAFHGHTGTDRNAGGATDRVNHYDTYGNEGGLNENQIYSSLCSYRAPEASAQRRDTAANEHNVVPGYAPYEHVAKLFVLEFRA